MHVTGLWLLRLPAAISDSYFAEIAKAEAESEGLDKGEHPDEIEADLDG